MEKIWFVYSSKNQKVSGPFNRKEIQRRYNDGEITKQCHIWAKGQREWQIVSSWLETGSKENTPEPESLKPIWYVESGTKPVGPLTRDELLKNLQGIKNLSKTRLWSVGMEKWKNIFEFHDIMEDLGISRRESDRAPLMGTVALFRVGDTATPMIAKTVSVSIGGLGISDVGSLVKGEDLSLSIKSSEFPVPIRVSAAVVYVSPSGHAGLRFTSIQAEVQALIFDYVKKFAIAEAA